MAVVTALGIPGLAQDGQERYIVVFADQTKDSLLSVESLRQQDPVAVGRVYNRAIKGFTFRGDPQMVRAMARRPDVAYVVADTPVIAIGQTIPRGMTRVKVNFTISINGESDDLVSSGVRVAVIDTGLDVDHPDLNVVGGMRFYNSGPFLVLSDTNYDDDHGHGTLVGGIAGAIDNGIGVVGVAPGVPLYGVKVLDAGGSGYTSAVIAGIDHLVDLNTDTDPDNNIQVANMSLRGSFNQAMNDAVSNAVQQGIVMVVAAGNDMTDVSIWSPGSEPDAITVSALADSDGTHGGLGPVTSSGNDDYFATLSNFGAGIDLCAPGIGILSTYRGGQYAVSSGTSMAAPHVAGAAALFIANHPNPYEGNTGLAAVNAVRQALLDAASNSGDSEYMLGGDPDGIAEPLLNVGGLKAAFGSLNTAPAVTIITPLNGSMTDNKTAIHFSAAASDLEDGDLSTSLVWTSSMDGSIGSGGSFSTLLSSGTHFITAAVSDSGIPAPVLADTDTLTITVEQSLSYEEWIDLYFPGETDEAIIGLNSDPDGDFILNGGEFGHGLNPLVADTRGVDVDNNLFLLAPGLPVVFQETTPSGPVSHVLFTRRKNFGAVDLSYATQFTSDMLAWYDFLVAPTVVDTVGDLELVSAAFPASLPDSSRPIAARVEVELTIP